MTGVFEVEQILASKKSKGKTLYKVRWKTFGPEEDTWEPVSHLRGCKELLLEFNAREEAKKTYKTQTKTEIKHTSNSVSFGRSPAMPDVKIVRNGGGDSVLSRRSIREGISRDVRSGVTTIITPRVTLRVTKDGKSKDTTSSRMTTSKTNAADVKDTQSTNDVDDRMSPYVFFLFVLIIVAVLFYIYQPL